MKSYFLIPFLLFALPHSALLGQYYVYNNSQDSIRLTQITDRPFSSCNSFEIIDSVQINNKGSKEIVFHRTCILTIRDHGGMFDIVEDGYISKYEIWDLDSKECLFEAVHNYFSAFSRSHGYYPAKWPEVGEGSESYSYDFEIDSLGTIVISNFTSALHRSGATEPEEVEVAEVQTPFISRISPNQLDGTYIYDHTIGEYVREPDH